MTSDQYQKQLESNLEQLRDIEGFPSGDTDTILQWSLPTNYTACPNPFIEKYVAGLRGPDGDHYHREPLASDVSAGRGDPIYRGQVYHTKVPPKAISRYIEHFCPEDGVVFDGFCGSGMTGIAARLTGRTAILNDLSPAATALAAAFCLPIDPEQAQNAVTELIQRLDKQCGHLYHRDNADDPGTGEEMKYVIHSEVYSCPGCGAEAPFSEIGFDFDEKRPAEHVVCTACDKKMDAGDLQRCLDENGKTIEVPVRTKYTNTTTSAETPIDDTDIELLQYARENEIPYPYPDDLIMHNTAGDGGWGDMWRRGYHSGIHRVTDFYYRRTLWVIAAALSSIDDMDYSGRIKHLLRTTVINTSLNLTKMRRAYQGVLPLVLYLPRLRRECNAIRTLERSADRTIRALQQLPDDNSNVAISTQSSTDLPNIPDDCVDYVFTDPPFGQNIIYSEVNFLWETWMGIFTNQNPEAIVSDYQQKGVDEYGGLMQQCFAEAHRILKPGRWITVVFHNSNNDVWAAIQRAMENAGFIVADVQTLDKQAQAFKAAVSDTAVKQDLVISAYKPRAATVQPDTEIEHEHDVWAFVRKRLNQLPLPSDNDDDVDTEKLAERQDYMLYNRMVAEYVLRGVPVPIGSAEFYDELRERFHQHDGLFFTEHKSPDTDK